MAKRTKTELTTYLKLENPSISSIRKYSFGVFFTLKIDGASFYNLRYVPASATREAFIDMPEAKGKDGVYYDLYYLHFSPEDKQKIIDIIEARIKDQEVNYG